MKDKDIQFWRNIESRITIPQKYDENACRDIVHDMVTFIIEEGAIHKITIQLFKELGVYPDVFRFIWCHRIPIIQDPNHWIVQLLEDNT